MLWCKAESEFVLYVMKRQEVSETSAKSLKLMKEPIQLRYIHQKLYCVAGFHEAKYMALFALAEYRNFVPIQLLSHGISYLKLSCVRFRVRRVILMNEHEMVTYRLQLVSGGGER